jgi:hypothetical protein
MRVLGRVLILVGDNDRVTGQENACLHPFAAPPCGVSVQSITQLCSAILCSLFYSPFTFIRP